MNTNTKIGGVFLIILGIHYDINKKRFQKKYFSKILYTNSPSRRMD